VSFLSLTLSVCLPFRPLFRLSFFPYSLHSVCGRVHNTEIYSLYLRPHDPPCRQRVGCSTIKRTGRLGGGFVALRLISLNHASTRKELSHAHTWEWTGAVSPVTIARHPPSRTRHLAVARHVASPKPLNGFRLNFVFSVCTKSC
jgi:hypothetical protein